jgi:hypothetical protein
MATTPRAKHAARGRCILSKLRGTGQSDKDALATKLFDIGVGTGSVIDRIMDRCYPDCFVYSKQQIIAKVQARFKTPLENLTVQQFIIAMEA